LLEKYQPFLNALIFDRIGITQREYEILPKEKRS